MTRTAGVGLQSSGEAREFFHCCGRRASVYVPRPDIFSQLFALLPVMAAAATSVEEEWSEKQSIPSRTVSDDDHDGSTRIDGDR